MWFNIYNFHFTLQRLTEARFVITRIYGITYENRPEIIVLEDKQAKYFHGESNRNLIDRHD